MKWRIDGSMWTLLETPARIVLFLTIIALPATTLGAQTRSLRLASTPWSPFTNEPGKPRFALDLVHTALDRLGIKPDTIIIDEGSLTPSLLSGAFDGSAALWRDEVRERVLVYSQPYLENRLILVGRSGSDVTAKKLTDLAGRRLALVEGYSYGDAVKGPNGPTYIPALSEEDSLQKVLNGSADYTLMDELVVEYILKNHSEEARSRLSIGSGPLLVRTLHLAINRKVPDAQRIIDLFNAEVIKMVADRSYHRLLQLDWIEADVNGDGNPEYVPRNDRPGPNPPAHSYKLFTYRNAPDSAPKPSFYLGGKVYPSWSAVPQDHKYPTQPGGVTAGSEFTIFTFKF
jgi:ABC-type amino acid transport substrate-binding protein